MKDSMYSIIQSVIRTTVPYATVWLISLFPVLAGHEASLDAGLVWAIGTIWYTLIRTLETKYPALGILLGSTTAPEYHSED